MKTALLKPPDQAEREYTRLLVWYARKIATSARAIVLPSLPNIVSGGKDTLKADGYIEDISTVLLTMLDSITESSRVVEARLPTIFALLARNNDRALILAVKASTGKTLPPAIPEMRRSFLGVDVYRGEPWLKDMQEGWVRQNVALVKSIGTQYHAQLETIIRQGVLNGSSVKTVSDQIKAQFGVTENRAVLIAQDQILGANARLTQIRAESIGVEGYIWHTVGDSRVRPAHADLNGKRFTWSKPSGEGHPGSKIRCRCRASIILPEF